MHNNAKRITDLFNIKYPIIQGGMVWVSGGKLAAAVSNAGGLGLIGAGSMKPDVLRAHILKAQALTNKPLGVNVPIFYELALEQINTSLDLGIKIFFTSAGSPKKYTQYLKEKGAIVVHVTSSPELALKCEEAGVDAIVCEGFEAGGHNGREELTTLTLIPQVLKEVKIPVIAAGGIGNGSAILSMLALGASGVQMGTRFLMTRESSAHENFKNYCLKATSSSTFLRMKKTMPVRLLDNEFSRKIKEVEENYTGEELIKKLTEALGKGKARSGMLLGEVDQGELEVGQVVSLIKEIPSVADLIEALVREYNESLKNLYSL